MRRVVVAHWLPTASDTCLLAVFRGIIHKIKLSMRLESDILRWWWWHVSLAPQKDCTKIKREWHCQWCEDDTCVLGWGVVMHHVMVWAKAADHHGASGIVFSAATRVKIGQTKVP